MKRGWWRRNAWGLVALGPALAAMAFAALLPNLDQWRRRELPVLSAAADGSVSMAGARVTLVELTEAQLTTYGGKPFELPHGVMAWRAVLRLESADPTRNDYCEIALEDAAGRVFETGADEIDRADIGFATCKADPSPAPALTPSAAPGTAAAVPSPTTGPGTTPAGSGVYQTVAYFATPVGTEAVAVRLHFPSDPYHDYRLTPQG
ncbi:hypothetical protein QEZ54_02470 [Catellatospora sp. KI3]|uniref:hypothetical protein n=1 Tax=Catellatospora sp. KI3 TaxID=3041620 RepID=UPI002482544C|nr:hypothetical protein [Catellatospora sp. KI3]MDI1459822.1 hypothetical protein [Catellatospora sp. KI3]